MLNELAINTGSPKDDPNAERIESENFGSTTVEFEIKQVKTQKRITNNLKRLPMSIWFQVSSFLYKVAKDNNSEAVVSLTLFDDEWIVIPWMQYPSGTLSVDFDQSSDENQELLRELSGNRLDDITAALELVHCTIHSHNKAQASQSPQDEKDEILKNGWHITLGNYNLAKLSIHCRFNVKKDAEFNEEGERVRKAFQRFIKTTPTICIEPVPMPKNLHPLAVGHLVTAAEDIIRIRTDEDFPDEWYANVHPEEKEYPVNQAMGNQGMGGGYDYQNYSEEEYYDAAFEASQKKNNHQTRKFNPLIEQLKSSDRGHASLFLTLKEVSDLAKLTITRAKTVLRSAIDGELEKGAITTSSIKWAIKEEMINEEWSTQSEFKLVKNTLPHQNHIYNVLYRKIKEATKRKPKPDTLPDEDIENVIGLTLPTALTVEATIQRLIQKLKNERAKKDKDKINTPHDSKKTGK